MTIAGNDTLPNGLKALRSILVLALLAPVLAACAGSFDASTSTRFDSASAKAIVVVGTSVNRAQQEEYRAGRSLSTYWQEYDLAKQRLVPEGRTFLTKVLEGPFSDADYRSPTVTIMEIEPGDYALIGAGFPHLMTLYVNTVDGNNRTEARTYVVDPRKHVDPQAAVNPGRNFLFSAKPGQIVYIGHFQFVKLNYLDRLVGINYSQDLSAARAALQGYPGIMGEIVPLDLTVRTETAAR